MVGRLYAITAIRGWGKKSAFMSSSGDFGERQKKLRGRGNEGTRETKNREKPANHLLCDSGCTKHVRQHWVKLATSHFVAVAWTFNTRVLLWKNTYVLLIVCARLDIPLLSGKYSKCYLKKPSLLISMVIRFEMCAVLHALLYQRWQWQHQICALLISEFFNLNLR